MASLRLVNNKEIGVKVSSQYFTQTKQILNRLHAQFSLDTKEWIIKLDDYFEFKAWLDYYNLPINYLEDEDLKIYNRVKVDCELEIQRKEIFSPNVLRPSVNLFNYQKEDTNILVKKNRNFIFHDPGLGKTLEAIAYFSHLFFNKKVDKIFVLVENNLLFHWRREILEYTYLFNLEDIILINNSNKKNFRDYVDKKIFVISHNTLQDIILDLKEKKMKSSKGKKLLKSKIMWSKLHFNFKDILKVKNLAIIVDESHKFKTSSSVLTKSLFACISSFDYRTLMTATPYITAYEDIFTQAKLLDPGLFNESEKSFKINISKKIGDAYSEYTIIERDAGKINEYSYALQDYTIKRLKSDLPEMEHKQMIKPIYFELPNKIRKIYQDIKDKEVGRIRETKGGGVVIDELVTSFPYLTQLLDNPLLLKGKLDEFSFIKNIEKLKFDDNPKVEYIDELLKDLVDFQNTKLVIYDSHPLTIDLLQERYKDKYGSHCIHGQIDNTAEERQEKIDSFNDPNSACKLIILSFLTSSSGINLNKSCHTLVIFSLPNAPMLWKQGIDRIYRINNTKDVNIYPLLFDGTYDNLRYESTLRRTEFNDKYLNRKLSVSEIDSLLNYKYAN